MNVTEFKIATNPLRAGADGTIPRIIEGSIEKARPPCVITLQKGEGASGVFGDDFGVMAFNMTKKYR